MECKICFEKYDQQLRKPVSINCGHSFCKTCLSSLKVSNSYACPTCRQSITNEQPNYTVLDLLEYEAIEDYNTETNANKRNLKTVVLSLCCVINGILLVLIFNEILIFESFLF
jgi:hypothetical protein